MPQNSSSMPMATFQSASTQVRQAVSPTMNGGIPGRPILSALRSGEVVAEYLL